MVLYAMWRKFVAYYNWSNIYTEINCNNKVSMPHEVLRSALNQFVPLRNKYINKQEKLWFNKIIKIAIEQRNSAYKIWKRNRRSVFNQPNNANWLAFVSLRERVASLFSQAKTKFNHRKLNPNLPPIKLWNNIRSLSSQLKILIIILVRYN